MATYDLEIQSNDAQNIDITVTDKETGDAINDATVTATLRRRCPEADEDPLFEDAAFAYVADSAGVYRKILNGVQRYPIRSDYLLFVHIVFSNNYEANKKLTVNIVE
jgi:hypothetical protein